MNHWARIVKNPLSLGDFLWSRIILMSKVITKQQISRLVENKYFKSEKELEEYIVPSLIELFKIKPSQIDRQSITTSFDHTLSNCADIVIRTDDNFKKAMIVIELKLSRNVEKFKGGNYDEALKQLHKYSQDTRALYGILLTNESCFIYKYKYFIGDQEYKREAKNSLPVINKIEDNMALNAFINFALHKKSLKYIYLFFALALIIGLLTKLVMKIIFKIG